MPDKSVLVIEDDAAIRRGLVDALEFAGYATHEADNFADARSMATGVDCDLVLLDLVLPGGRDERTGRPVTRSVSGLDILQTVRELRPTLPVIILTARGDESDRIAGLRLGADDYVVKPFSVKELLAHIEAVLRRSPQRPTDVHELLLGEAVVDMVRGEVRYGDGERADLTEREIELLRYLARHPDRPISRDELLRHVWRINPDGCATRTVDMQVMRLREKLRDDTPSPQWVLTVRGKGYMINLERVDVQTHA